MSGYKRATVTIGQDEYDRLRDAEIKLRAMPEIPVQTTQRIVQESLLSFRSSVAEVQQRQSIYEQYLSGVDESIRQLETNTNQALLTYEANTAADLENYAGCLWNNVNQVLQQYATHFEEEITANHHQQQQELANITRRVRRISFDRQRKQELADLWINAAMQIAEFIDQTYTHEYFTPGKVDQLNRQLNLARENQSSGLSEAVILSSQQVYMAFSDLRVELERLSNEWRLLYQAACEATTQLVEQAKSVMVVEAMDLDGQDLPYEVNVDYWTQGRLSQIIKELSEQKKRLDIGEDLPGSDDLRIWLEKDLPDYYRKLETLVLDARVYALNSQLRINIADLVVQALQEQGFSLEAAQYESGDWRNGYTSRLMNIEGNEVIVQVTPGGQLLGENELNIRSLDSETRTEHELEQRWYEVSKSLNKYGLDVGAYTQTEASMNKAPRQPGRKPNRNLVVRRQQPTSNLSG
jgi:hypothetical protein